jgi:hypothetical protein
VDRSIKKAKKKAEDFLFNIIRSTTNRIYKKDLSILEPTEDSDIPFMFEAYSYLCHKDENLKPRYAQELRDLWLHWQKFRKTLKPKALEVFYPAAEYYYPKNEKEPIWEPFDPQRHITMLRTKEILGIPGFQDDFDKVIKILKNYLLSGYGFDRNCWIIFRSITIQNALKQYIQKASFLVLEKIKNRDLNNELKMFQDKENWVKVIDRWINCVIFLVMSRLGEDYFNVAKLTVDKLISYQENNGSISEDILSTCSFAISVYFTETDPSKIIQTKALEWLLSQQSRVGSWNHWIDVRDKRSSEWSVLATVIVLETIDLITNQEPLPLWVPEEKPVSYPEREQKRIQPIKRFPTPPGTNWYGVSIRFLSEETVQIITKSYSEGRDFREMGFMDRRANKPDKLWLTLRLFAKHDGEISWQTPGLPREPEKLKSYIKDIRKRLKYLFQIKDDPFESYKKVRAYKTKFNIKILDDIDN